MKGKKKEIRTREASGRSTIGEHKSQKEAFKIHLKDYSILGIIQKTCCVWIKKTYLYNASTLHNYIVYSHPHSLPYRFWMHHSREPFV